MYKGRKWSSYSLCSKGHCSINFTTEAFSAISYSAWACLNKIRRTKHKFFVPCGFIAAGPAFRLLHLPCQLAAGIHEAHADVRIAQGTCHTRT